MKTIVTTTIYPPTKATLMFSSMSDWEMIIVGDKKTPHDIYNSIKNVIYLSPEYQDKTYKDLSDLIGWNKIMRRNLGFVEAYRRGAEIIASVDDDNIPFDGWGKNILVGQEIEMNVYTAENGCFDPLSVTDHNNLWHRGYPIQLLSSRKSLQCARKKVKVDIQADLWNGDPDIDALCRFEHAPICDFSSVKEPYASDSFSPFNSQNTFISREALKNYFVLPHVGRMDDIWASYYIESLGYRVIYNSPTVYQDRNKQDLTKNLENEVVGYLNTLNLISSLKENSDNIQKFIPENSWKALREYKRYFD